MFLVRILARHVVVAALYSVHNLAGDTMTPDTPVPMSDTPTEEALKRLSRFITTSRSKHWKVAQLERQVAMRDLAIAHSELSRLTAIEDAVKFACELLERDAIPKAVLHHLRTALEGE